MYDGSDTIILFEELAYQDVLAVAWRPLPAELDADLMASFSISNVRVLQACAALEEHSKGEKPEENSPHSADLIRIDFKINLLLDLVGKIMTANHPRPTPVPIRFNAVGATWRLKGTPLQPGNQGALEIKEAVYRIDPKTATIELVTDAANKPNGLCFSPDYKKLYLCDTGTTMNITVWDVVDGRKLSNGREFASTKQKLKDGSFGGVADGVRADADGNIWAGMGWVGEGFDGVHIFAPDGQVIGQILLPEICSNICFGGPKRNRLFMTASQSLYAVYVNTQGAHIC